MPRRYAIAVVVAILLIAGAFWLAQRARQSVMAEMRGMLRAEQAAGRLSPEFQNADLDSIDLNDMGVVISSQQMRWLGFADFIQSAWFIWAPTVLLACLGLSHLFGK